MKKKLNKDKNQNENCFFSKFSPALIFEAKRSSRTILELAQKLGLSDSESLTRDDYVYIGNLKTCNVWKEQLAGEWNSERDRYKYIKELSAEDLQSAMDSDVIQTLGHLAVHFLVSKKHGRKKMRELILELKLPVKSELHKGVFGLSETPILWPTRFYEKRIGPKPTECNACQFKAINPRQIELHHPTDIDGGSPGARTSSYFSAQVEPICANCHSLEHRTGEKLRNKCGQWSRRLPGNQKYKNPSDIFRLNYPETYRVQKNYYLKWHLTDSSQYKCEKCGVDRWGPGNKLLSLELHHKDRDNTNSLISNFELLCPNCHRAES